MTICTASALYCGLNFRRFTGMDRILSDQEPCPTSLIHLSLRNGPAGGVEASVVEAAQQDQVLSDGGPAVGPVADVVGLGPLHRPPTPGPGASVGLLELELPPQGGVGQAQGASEFDGFAGAVVEH